MKLNFVKISPAQNTTVLVTDYVNSQAYPEIARSVMSYEYLLAEQVGFIVAAHEAQAVLRLEMSGGEFCANGLLSAAALSVYKGICQEGSFLVESSGSNRPLCCQVSSKAGNVFAVKGEMPQPVGVEEVILAAGEQAVRGKLVHLPGISHFVTEFWPSVKEYDQLAENLQEKTSAQALGIIPYRNIAAGKYEILPYVCVTDTGSRVFEKACGSGSLSLGIHLAGGKQQTALQVDQPGGSITVEIGEKNYIRTDAQITCEGTVFIK